MTESTSFASNEEVAGVLFKVASILELLQENPFRIRAYRRAALQVLFLPAALAEYVSADEEAPLRGVGERMRFHLVDLVNTGHMGVYENLLVELGEPLASLIRFKGVGPKTALRLMRELRLQSLEDLAKAASEGRIQVLSGFGVKREESLRRQAVERLLDAA